MAELAERQADVLSRRQLLQAGVDRWRIRSEVRARRWRVVGRHAVVLHRGPLTYDQRCWAYVLHAGRPSLLGGLSALQVAGLRGWEDARVRVLVPKGRCTPALPDLVLHETRRWPQAGRPGLPRTAVARAAVDAAIRMCNPRSAAGVLAAVVQQRLESADALLAELTAAGRVRHRRLLATALVDIAGGSQSLTEIDFIRLCRSERLPEPHRQSRRRDRSGRIRYLDAEWILPSGQRVVAEVDGAIHLQPRSYWDDMARDNAQTLDGALVLRFPSVAWQFDRAHMVAQLRASLEPLLRPA